MTGFSAARSDVGRVRTSNQDSGYAGQFLFIVADGMGGHAGGDVASGIAVRDLAKLDRPFASVAEAKKALSRELQVINNSLSLVVDNQPELAGLGTTVSALLRVDDRFVIAHIGDSRVYRLTNGELTQVTKDHTFVQQLIDAGRITQEEAKDHPRRSVLMRVLGDVEDQPSIDIAELPAIPGERWLLCSDGLTGAVPDGAIADMLTSKATPEQACSRLVDRGLRAGAPDNITIVVLDVAEETEARSDFVGAASSQRKLPERAPADTGASPRTKTRTIPVSTSELPLPPLKPAATSHVPDQSSARDARNRRRLWAVVVSICVVGVVTVVAILGYQWTQSRYYLGVAGSHVAVFQGIPVTLAGLPLSEVYLETDVLVASLSTYERDQVRQTISFDNASDAVTAVNRMAGD
jgi:protein phosphatase